MIGIQFMTCQFGYVILLLIKLMTITKKKKRLKKKQSNPNATQVMDSSGKLKAPELVKQKSRELHIIRGHQKNDALPNIYK